jgi:hypothetical protein
MFPVVTIFCLVQDWMKKSPLASPDSLILLSINSFSCGETRKFMMMLRTLFFSTFFFFLVPETKLLRLYIFAILAFLSVLVQSVCHSPLLGRI